jgi:hypothetical protein
MEASANFARKGGGKVKGILKEAPTIVKGKRTAIMEEKRTAISSYVQRPRNEGENFVTIASLREVWKWEGLQEFIEGIGLGFEASKEDLNFIEKNLLKTFSILVYIRWKPNKWQKFPEIFMKDGRFRDDRLDDKLPYDLDVIKHKDFLGSFGEDFYAYQNIFIPIVLREGEIIKHKRGRRLPLKTGGKELGSGAYGKVTKEVIPEGHLVSKDEGEAVTLLKSHQNIS